MKSIAIDRERWIKAGRALLADWFSAADVRMALRNVFRQKARTALTLSIIGAGVACLILSGGFVEYALNTLRESTIHAQLGHLQIYKKGYYAEGKRSPYKYLIDKPDEVAAMVDALPQVKESMARLSFAGILNNGKSDFAILGEGIEPAKEARLGTEIQLIDGRKLTADDHFGVMLGEGVASGMALHVGDVINLLLNTEEGALNNLEFKVVGVFRTFSKDYDARAVRISLPDAQELLASKAVNAIVVNLKRTDDTNEVAALLRARLDGNRFEVKTWLDLADFYEKTAALFKRQFAFLQTIILLSVLLSVANSVNMTIFERTGEFGTLMALGTRRGPIFRLVLFENMFVGFIGSLFGVVLGVLLGGILNALQLPMPPPPNSNSGYAAGITLQPGIIVIAFIVGFLATPLTALWPARRIARVPVVDALRMN
jgi:putative ABC transport system permease protein